MFNFKGLYVRAVFVVVVCSCINYTTSLGHTTTDDEWNNYKATFKKDYQNSPTLEAYAKYYYSYNKRYIEYHNTYYNLGRFSYKLGINQFTDMRFLTFKSMFPETRPRSQFGNSTLPKLDTTATIANSFDPKDVGIETIIEDQGTVCNSGWAYSTAKALELLQAYQSGQAPARLSAQNLIDCAGQSSGCTEQIPQTGFNYLAERKQELYLETDYRNNNTQCEQGMCVLPTEMRPRTVTLKQYGFIDDGDDETMRRYVAAQYPVVIEFNPTSFEFMHYAEGIFQQPATSHGSHFMTVIGYGVNETSNVNYFTVQNSFGTTWGDGGLIKIAYSKMKPLAKSAILPIF